MEKKCDYCGKTFETNLKRQRFCCGSCHTKWHNEHDESHSWAAYEKRRALAKQKHTSAEQRLAQVAKQIEKEAKKRTREEEREACENIMSCLMDKLAFENYRDMLTEAIPGIIMKVISQSELTLKSYTYDLQFKNQLKFEIEYWVDEHISSKPKEMSKEVNVHIWDEAYTYLQSHNISLQSTDKTYPKWSYLVVTVGDYVGFGYHWWLGYLAPVWPWNESTSVKVHYPKWTQFDDWEGK